MFGHLLKRGAAMLCLAAVLALPVCAEGRITTDMTMKEIRSDPAIAGSGVSTYCKGDADSLAHWYRDSSCLTYPLYHFGVGSQRQPRKNDVIS